jgi:polyisoprenoid-binding protein YceI
MSPGTPGSTAATGAMSTTTGTALVIDPVASRLTVRVFAGGMLSALGHDPTLAVREYQGEIKFDPETLTGSLVLRITADSITVQGDMSDKDRREIERIMKQEVLEISKYPEILYAAPEASVRRTGDGQFDVTLAGSLSLHGVTQREPISGRATVMGTMLRVFGDFALRLPDYDIKPVTIAGGALKVKDELKGAFDIVARR